MKQPALLLNDISGVGGSTHSPLAQSDPPMNATIQILLDDARAAGRANRGVDDWANSDAVQSALDALDAAGVRVDFDDVHAAYADGYRAYQLAAWTLMWTTAPAAYDSGGTTTVDDGGDWCGKHVRRVAIEPESVGWQTTRYGSGMHGAWPEDPRVTEARQAAQARRERDQRTQALALRDAGLQWIRTADPSVLELTDVNYDVWHEHELTTEDVRVERARRTEVDAAAARAAEFCRCLAIVDPGMTIIDPGAPRVAAGHPAAVRAPYVWIAVQVVRGWPQDDPAKATVVGEGGETAGSLIAVADALVAGRLRVAGPADVVPPLAVMKRVGHRDLSRYRRMDVGGTIVWIGGATFAYEPLILDGDGHIVRKKSIRNAAACAGRGLPQPIVTGIFRPDVWKRPGPHDVDTDAAGHGVCKSRGYHEDHEGSPRRRPRIHRRRAEDARYQAQQPRNEQPRRVRDGRRRVHRERAPARDARAPGRDAHGGDRVHRADRQNRSGRGADGRD